MKPAIISGLRTERASLIRKRDAAKKALDEAQARIDAIDALIPSGGKEASVRGAPKKAKKAKAAPVAVKREAHRAAMTPNSRPVADNVERGEIVGEVAAAVSQMRGEFNHRHVLDQAKAKNASTALNPEQVKRSLDRLLAKGDIETATPGQGRRPTTYRMKGNRA